MANRTLLVAALVLAACGNNLPCTECPPIEGRYAMTYKDLSLDGGCGERAAPVQVLDIARSGSELTSPDAGLSGTLYDTFDFSLRARAGGELRSLSYTGKYVAGIADGGDRIRGDYRASFSTDAGTCASRFDFEGARIP
jgi:hypothetical protein